MQTIVAEEPRETKYMTLRNSLYQFIKGNPPGTRLPSYGKIAGEYGVSLTTINRALQEFDDLQLIDRQAKRGIFISNRAAQKNIGIIFGGNVFDSVNSPVYRLYLEYIERHLVQENENATTFIDIPQVRVKEHDIQVSQALLDAMESKRFDGLVLIAPRGPSEVKWLAGYDIPLVVNTLRAPEAWAVFFGNEGEIVEIGTESLLQQGCRSIALLLMGGNRHERKMQPAIDAYRRLLTDNAIPFDENLIWDHSKEYASTHNNELIGHLAAGSLLTGSDHPIDGLVSNDDMATRGVLMRMQQLNLTPGRDVKIATHVNRNLAILPGYEKMLTLIEVDIEILINETFNLLTRLMAGENIPRGTSININRCIRKKQEKQQ